LAPIECDQRSLIHPEHLALRVAWIDPELVIVIATRSALDGRERFATVRGAIHRRVADIDKVRIAGVDRDPAEIPTALPDAAVIADPRPARARIVRAIEPAGGGINQRKHPLGSGGRNGETDPSRLTRQTPTERIPGLTAVDRLVQAPTRAA